MTDQSEGPNGRGVMVWRAVRYAVAIGVGYVAGISVGGMASDTPALPLLAVAIGLALLFAFRQGAKSQAHAAADAISAANARAAAVAVASNTVNVAGGHIVTPSGNTGYAEPDWDTQLAHGAQGALHSGRRVVDQSESVWAPGDEQFWWPDAER